MALILCIETSTDVCSVALARDGQIIALAESAGGRDHSRLVGVYVGQVLRDAGAVPTDLSAVSVSSGPGSYTGLRIGVSLAKGLCYGLGIPLISVGSLESLARVAVLKYQDGLLPGVPDFNSSMLCPMIDARRMEVYAQVFDARPVALGEVVAEVVTPDSFASFRSRGRMVIFGDGAAKCAGELGGDVVLADVAPSAVGLAAPAFAALEAGRTEDVAYFEPVYLKDFLIKPSSKKFF